MKSTQNLQSYSMIEINYLCYTFDHMIFVHESVYTKKLFLKPLNWTSLDDIKIELFFSMKISMVMFSDTKLMPEKAPSENYFTYFPINLINKGN